MFVDIPVWLSVGSILTSGVVAVAVVVLGANFAGKQAHLQRIWDRKAESYTAILEALHEMDEWFSQALDDEFLRRDVDESISAARAADYQAAYKRLKRSVAREVWLLPVAVQDRTLAMNKVLSARYDSWFEDIDAGCAEVGKTIGDIAEYARGDLIRARGINVAMMKSRQISKR